MGDDATAEQFLTQVRKACRIAKMLQRARRPPLWRRPHRLGLLAGRLGREPEGQHATHRRHVPPRLRRRRRLSASGSPPRAKSAGAACTVPSGWSSCWKSSTARARSASRPTWPTRCSTCWATTRPKIASCLTNFDWNDTAAFDAAYEQLTDTLRPWTIDFHVAQNNGAVLGSGSHDKTGRHCLANDPDGKLDIVKYAGYWLRDDKGNVTKTLAATSAGTAACSPTPC